MILVIILSENITESCKKIANKFIVFHASDSSFVQAAPLVRIEETIFILFYWLGLGCKISTQYMKFVLNLLCHKI